MQDSRHHDDVVVLSEKHTIREAAQQRAAETLLYAWEVRGIVLHLSEACIECMNEFDAQPGPLRLIPLECFSNLFLRARLDHESCSRRRLHVIDHDYLPMLAKKLLSYLSPGNRCLRIGFVFRKSLIQVRGQFGCQR